MNPIYEAYKIIYELVNSPEPDYTKLMDALGYLGEALED